jgi:hypothetical protein
MTVSGKPPPQPPMSPGDDARPGTPGTGEDLRKQCNGSGRTARGDPSAPERREDRAQSFTGERAGLSPALG